MWLVVLCEGRWKWGRSLITLVHSGADLQHMMDEDLGNCGFYEVCEMEEDKTWKKRSVWRRLWGRSAALPRSAAACWSAEMRSGDQFPSPFVLWTFWSNIKAWRKHQILTKTSSKFAKGLCAYFQWFWTLSAPIGRRQLPNKLQVFSVTHSNMAGGSNHEKQYIRNTTNP